MHLKIKVSFEMLNISRLILLNFSLSHSRYKITTATTKQQQQKLPPPSGMTFSPLILRSFFLFNLNMFIFIAPQLLFLTPGTKES